MRESIRSRLTFSNVVAVIALFVALGGTAFAASKLAKNSVGTKQLKNGAVTGKKLKKNAVTSDKVADGSLTGSDLDLGSLGSVPSADSVGGQKVTKFFVKFQPGELNKPIFNVDGFKLVASCIPTVGGGSIEDLNLDPPANDATVTYAGNGSTGPVFGENAGVENNSVNLDDDGTNNNKIGVSTFAATRTTGTPVLTGVVAYDTPLTLAQEDVCVVYGHVVSG